MNRKRLIHTASVLLLLLPVAALAANPPSEPVQAPDYRVAHSERILPEGEVLGSVAVAGVGVDSHGNVFVFHRAGRTWPDSDVLELMPVAPPTSSVWLSATVDMHSL